MKYRVLRLQCFGSSTRRGAPGWTDPRPIRALMVRLIEAGYDLHVAHGASPSGGADKIVDDVARELLIPFPKCVHPFPVESQDGSWPRAPMMRNARMRRDFNAQIAAGFVHGKVGECVGTKGHYLSNGSDEMATALDYGMLPVPLVIFREDGIEPCRRPLLMLRRLYANTGSHDLVAPGKAVAKCLDLAESPCLDDTMISLAAAREVSPFAPWLQSVEAYLRGLQSEEARLRAIGSSNKALLGGP